MHPLSLRVSARVLAAAVALLPVVARAADADLDQRFNVGTVPALNGGIGQGSATVDFDNLGGGFDVARGIARLPSGKYLVAALVNPGAGGRVGLVRLNADGTRDTSFGAPGDLGRILRHNGVLQVAGPVLYGTAKLYYAFSVQASAGDSVVVVCRIGLDGTPDATFKTWGYGGSSPQGVGCSIADHASAPTWGAEVSDIDVQPGTGWVVTALTYRQGSAAAAPTNGAFTLMDDTGKDVFAGTVFDAPVFHDVTSDGDYEAARKVHFSRSSGAGAYDFFLAWDYQPAGAPRRALLRRYDALTPMEEIVVPALSDANHASVGGLAFETGPGSLGFDAAALVLLNESDGDDGSGALFRPSLERIPIDPASGALMAQGALFQSLDGFCASLAALQVRESCLVTSAVYDRASRQLWMAGSWRSQGSAIYSDVLLGRLQRTDQGGVPYLPRPLSFGDAFKRYAFNGSVGESRRHWGAALMLDDTRPVIAGDRQLDANDPGNIDHDVLLLRVRGADRLFDDGFERAY